MGGGMLLLRPVFFKSLPVLVHRVLLRLPNLARSRLCVERCVLLPNLARKRLCVERCVLLYVFCAVRSTRSYRAPSTSAHSCGTFDGPAIRLAWARWTSCLGLRRAKQAAPSPARFQVRALALGLAAGGAIRTAHRDRQRDPRNHAAKPTHIQPGSSTVTVSHSLIVVAG